MFNLRQFVNSIISNCPHDLFSKIIINCITITSLGCHNNSNNISHDLLRSSRG